jgi:hypothetical protein
VSDRDAIHTLTELQEARAEIDKLRAAILKHKQAMSEYRGAFYDEELWLAICPMPIGKSGYIIDDVSNWRPIGPMPGKGGE